MTATDPREVKQLINEADKARRLPLDQTENFFRRSARGAVPKQMDRVRNRRQRVSELMAEHRGEFVLAVHGLPQLLRVGILNGHQYQLRALTVARDLTSIHPQGLRQQCIRE